MPIAAVYIIPAGGCKTVDSEPTEVVSQGRRGDDFFFFSSSRVNARISVVTGELGRGELSSAATRQCLRL